MRAIVGVFERRARGSAGGGKVVEQSGRRLMEPSYKGGGCRKDSLVRRAVWTSDGISSLLQKKKDHGPIRAQKEANCFYNPKSEQALLSRRDQAQNKSLPGVCSKE